MDFITAAFGSPKAPKSQRSTVALIDLGIFMSMFSFMAKVLSLLTYRSPDAILTPNSPNSSNIPHEPRSFLVVPPGPEYLPYHILQISSIIFQNVQIPILHLAFAGLIYARGQSMRVVKPLRPDQRVLRSLVVYGWAFMLMLVLSFVTPPIFQYVLRWQWSECIPTLTDKSGSGNLDDISQESIDCTAIWNLFTWMRSGCAWAAWYLLIGGDWLSITIVCAMDNAHKTPTDSTKHYSKVVTYALLLACGLLLWQSTYLNLHPTTRRAMYKPATDITYFDMVDVTRGTFWLSVYFLFLGCLAGHLEWPALKAFEEAQEMVKDVDAVGSLGEKDSSLPK